MGWLFVLPLQFQVLAHKSSLSGIIAQGTSRETDYEETDAEADLYDALINAIETSSKAVTMNEDIFEASKKAQDQAMVYLGGTGTVAEGMVIEPGNIITTAELSIAPFSTWGLGGLISTIGGSASSF